MNIDPWIIINDYNFITWVAFELNNLNSLDSDLVNLRYTWIQQESDELY
jgi:hypothetical protein